MPVINCHSCDGRMTLPPTPPGRRVHCPHCAFAFVPGSQPVAVPVGAPAASTFDFDAPADDPLEFRDDLETKADRDERRKAFAPAAGWMRAASVLYLILANLYLIRTVPAVLYAPGTGAIFALAGGLVAVSLALALGLFLGNVAGKLGRASDVPDGLTAASLLALIGGALASLVAILALTVVGMQALVVARGGWLAEQGSIPFTLALGLFFLSVGGCSITAGIKGLVVRPDGEEAERPEPQRRARRRASDDDY